MYMFPDPKQSEASENRKTASGVRIGHIKLRVADLDRAISFYCDALGLSVIYYAPSVGIPTVFLAFGDYHHHVALTWFYNDGGSPKHSRHCGLNHFAIVYPDELLLAKAVARLLDRGGLIDDARDHGGMLSVYLRDPDGNGIELYYDRPQTRWVDSSGDLVMKSEPFDVRNWLKEFWARAATVGRPRRSRSKGQEITICLNIPSFAFGTRAGGRTSLPSCASAPHMR